MPNHTTTLRILLNGPEPIVVPMAYDAFSARLIERTGITEGFLDRMITFEERNEILGLAHFYELEARYGVEAA